VILVDSSVWIDHFRSTDPVLVAALEAGEVLMHPFILGELACGNLHRRQETLELLNNLPTAPVATGPEALVFIECGSLMGRGIGYIDVHLLASVALTGTGRLWTRDRRLAALAAELDLSFAEER
jgi:predicted nucleic acid-binding protein